MTDWEDTGEIIELFGIRFVGKRDLTTGRIYVASTPASKAALTVLKLKGEAQALKDASVHPAQQTEEPNAHDDKR